MPDHIHLLITPARDITIERAVQFIKGGYSHAVGVELGRRGEVWQRGFTDRPVRDGAHFEAHRSYIHQNPVRARLVKRAEEYRLSSAYPGYRLDVWPAAAEAACMGESCGTTEVVPLP